MRTTNVLKKMLVILGSAVLSIAAVSAVGDGAQQPLSENWPIIRASLFAGDREIVSDDTVSLITPKRAEDAATVPVSVNANINQSGGVYIKKIYLVVDNNPSPVVGVFTMTRINGLASLSTRIRINAYSNVRAVAETSDGKLHMATKFVKASGGCSTPAASNEEEAINRRGKMKLRQQKHDDLVRVQLLVSHPNHSGLQQNQLNQQWIPADYINELQVSFGTDRVISFAGGISMSENPSFGFYFKPDKTGNLLAEAKDSQGREYRHSWPISSL